MSGLDGLLVGALLLAAVVALRALPWTDDEIAAVHRAAFGLLRGRGEPSRRRRQGATRALLNVEQDTVV